jgi:hypothetical protein
MKKRLREYLCFVCSEEFEDYDSMKSHIFSNHREGDDFVVCTKCFCPLRDLINHYKTKHIGCQIPPNSQIRPIILRDCYKNKKTKFKQGNYISQKTNRNVNFRSGLELKFYEQLEKNPKVRDYRVENINIEYFFEGTKHTYTPDVLVEYTDGKIEMWEIKPKSQTKWPKNLAKWQAANIFCKNRNWEFIVVTENALKKKKP